MDHPGFFERAGPFKLVEVARACGAELAPHTDPETLVYDVRPLSEAGPDEMSFLDNRKYLPQLQTTRSCACLIHPELKDRLPQGTAALLTKQPYHGFAKALALFYPDALRPLIATPGQPAIDPTAWLEDGVAIEPAPKYG